MTLLVAVDGCSDGGGSGATATNAFYSTKTPYTPEQNQSSYEPAPAGYRPAFTQMVARHGARALTSSKNIDYIKQLIACADAEGALTDLGRQLLPQVTSLEEANVAVGYGNLGGLGVEEHQALAVRLLERLPQLFDSAASSGRHVMIVTSGKDRAVDSATNFAASLADHLPPLEPFIDVPITNRGLLYFFAENEE